MGHYGTTRRPRIAAICMLALVCGGCVTTSGNPEASQGTLSPPKALLDAFAPLTVPPKFRDAVRRNDIDTAATIYAEYAVLLERDAKAEVDQLAQLINARWNPKLEQARLRLEAATGAGTFDVLGWKDAAAASKRLLREYEEIPALKADHRRSDQWRALVQSTTVAQQRFRATAVQLFAQYDHAARSLFFTDLPDELTDLDREHIVRGGLPSLFAAMARASAEKAKELAAAYSSLLSQQDRNRLVSTYLSKLSGGAATAAQRLRHAQIASEIGGRPLQLLRLNSEHNNSQLRIDGSPQEEIVALSQVQGAIRSRGSAGERVVLLVDAANVAVVSELREPRTVTSRRQTGTRSAPNPAYREAQAEVQRLEQELRKLEADNANLQRQAQDLARQSAGKGGGAFAAMMGAVTGTTLVATTRKELEAARAALASTPKTIDQAIHAEFTLPAATRETRFVFRPTLYLVATDALQVYKASKDVIETERETVEGAAASVAPPSPPHRSTRVALDDFVSALERSRPTSLQNLTSLIAADRSSFQGEVRRLQQEAVARTAQSRQVISAAEARTSATSAAMAPPRAQQLASPLAQGAGGTGNCHTSLAYLDQRLPHFNVPMLQAVRQEIIRTDIRDTIRKAKEQGYTAESAVDASNAAARSMEDQVRTGSQCAAAVDAMGTTDEAFLQNIKRGELASIASCEGIRAGCLCAGLAARMGALASRAVAANMQCLARSGQW